MSRAQKEILSVSLGSSHRDHSVVAELLGESFHIRRVGTDGSFEKAEALLAEADGVVDAIGLGGIDIYVYSATTRYEMRDGARLRDVVRTTPIVDGSGLKDTLERNTVRFLLDNAPFPVAGQKVLMVCAVDRFGMAQALHAAGCLMTFGDLMFALDMPVPIRDFDKFTKVADEMLPKICNSSFDSLYPIGAAQDAEPETKHAEYYRDADIIAGDFHYIRRYMPDDLSGKVIITNTTTSADIAALERRGVSWLVTTTPRLDGRSFGTNVLEAALITMLDKPADQIVREDYFSLLCDLDLQPTMERLN